MPDVCLRLLEGLESKMDSFKFNTLLLAAVASLAWVETNKISYMMGDDVFHNIELTQGKPAAIERAERCLKALDYPIIR